MEVLMNHLLGRFGIPLILVAITFPAIGSETAELIKEGRALWEAKDYEAAARVYDGLIESDPTCADARYGRGLCHASQGDFDAAIRDFDEAIRLRPDEADAYLNRGKAQLGKGECVLAIEDFSRVIELKPDAIEPVDLRAKACMAADRMDDALRDLTRIIKAKPDSAEALALALRSVIHFNSRNYDEAIADADAALVIDPYSVQAYTTRGRVRHDTGDFDAAIDDSTRALALDPRRVEARYIRGLSYFKKGDDDEAIENLSECVRRYAKESPAFKVEVHRVRGAAFDRIGKKAAAEADFNEAQRLRLTDETDPTVVLLKAYQIIQASDFRAALEQFDKALRLDPKSTAAYLGRAASLQSLGRYGDAILDYTAVIRLEPTKADGYLLRGLAYSMQGEDRHALGDYTTAIRLDPQSPAAYIGRSDAYRKQGDFEAAIADATEGIRLESSPGMAYRMRCLASMDKGDFKRAVADADEVVRLAPEEEGSYELQFTALKNAGDFQQLVDAMTRGIEQLPESSKLYELRGEAYARLQREDEAQRDRERAVEIDPDCAVRHVAIAYKKYEAKDYDAALSESEIAMVLDPTSVLARFLRGCAHGSKGNLKKAIADYEACQQMYADETDQLKTQVDEAHAAAVAHQNKAKLPGVTWPAAPHDHFGHTKKREEPQEKTSADAAKDPAILSILDAGIGSSLSGECWAGFKNE
jgi:tetratricopeptide (TPR) repeat protein